MKAQDAINLLGSLDNASGQVCQMKDGKPTLILFDLGCSNCSEVATKNADELAEAIVTLANIAPNLLAACEAAQSVVLGSISLLYCWHCNTAATFSGDGTIPNPISHDDTCIVKQLERVIAKARGEA